MRKITASIFFVIVAVLLMACDKDVSYAERLESEKKRIKNFLSEQNIEVLKTYPSNGVFKSNQYYLDESGVYINVVDSGNGKRAVAYNKVHYRFSEGVVLDTDTAKLWEEMPNFQPFNFTYKITSSYTYPYSNSGDPSYWYLSEGVTIPLKYVGENAVVNLLVPFKVGSAGQSTYYATVFYKRLRYSKIESAQ